MVDETSLTCLGQNEFPGCIAPSKANRPDWPLTTRNGIDERQQIPGLPLMRQ